MVEKSHTSSCPNFDFILSADDDDSVFITSGQSVFAKSAPMFATHPTMEKKEGMLHILII